MKKLILVMVLLLSLQAQEPYKLGEGAQLGTLPIFMGGYASLDAKIGDERERYSVDDIAILAYGDYDKFSYMAEVEFKEFFVKTEEKTTSNDSVYVERIYVDYHFDDNFLFRIGKYNSPIGFWNLIPINVLQETTSSPKSLYILFPKTTTGLYSSYSTFESADLKVDFMFEHNRDFDDTYNNYKVDKHYALGITQESNEYAFKLNAGYFNDTQESLNRSTYYFLLSAKYEDEKYQFLSELGSQIVAHNFSTEFAGYVQGLYHFNEQHMGIVRLESYDNARGDEADSMVLVAYSYRPLYPVSIKAEYQQHQNVNLNQLLFSFSVLF